MEKIKTFEAHNDYIRCIHVHPSQPYIISSSDDSVSREQIMLNSFEKAKEYYKLGKVKEI